MEADDAVLASLPLTELEEQVVFAEWRALRQVSARSLGRMRQLMDQLDYSPDQTAHRTLGVVGSKGKGTASAYASAAAASRGVSVVTVMSPGVLSNADRIRLSGRVVSEDLRRSALLEIERSQRRLPQATEDSGYLAPTGVFLLMGFLMARAEGAEVVVAEAGIGGASDDLSHWPLDGVVVTGIFGEHLDLLGPAVEDVARDKSAVITDRTQWVVSCAQSPEVHAIIDRRCREVGASLVLPEHGAGPWLHRTVEHLPAGFTRQNAAAGVAAGLAISQQQPMDWEGVSVSAAQVRHLETLTRSVHYPGRLSVHHVPLLAGDAAAGGSARRCVVDSAVSRSGLRAALVRTRDVLVDAPQVLVCLPPSKDLPGFVDELADVPGRKVFVELPGAYVGTPARSEWPSGPGWEWVRLGDLGISGVHQAAGSGELLHLLRRTDSLAVGTVLFTSLVLRSIGADADQLFTAAG